MHPSDRITSLHVLFKRDWIRFWVQGGQSWADVHQAIGCGVNTEGGIRLQLGSYWTASRADAFPSAICLLHLKDNPLEIPPQMLARGKHTLDASVIQIYTLLCITSVLSSILNKL